MISLTISNLLRLFLRIQKIDDRVTTGLFNSEGFFASCDRVKLMPNNKMSLVVNTEKGIFWLRFIEKVHAIGFLKMMLNAKKTRVIEEENEIAAPAVIQRDQTPVLLKDSQSKKRKLESDDNSSTIDLDKSNDSDDDIIVVEEIKGDVNTKTPVRNVKSERLSTFEFCKSPILNDYSLPMAVEARIDLTRLIVSRLKKTVRSRDLEKLFTGAIDIQIEKESNKYNMAFIRFRTANDAKKSLDTMNHKDVFGRTITITYANKLSTI